MFKKLKKALAVSMVSVSGIHGKLSMILLLTWNRIYKGNQQNCRILQFFINSHGSQNTYVIINMKNCRILQKRGFYDKKRKIPPATDFKQG